MVKTKVRMNIQLRTSNEVPYPGAESVCLGSSMPLQSGLEGVRAIKNSVLAAPPILIRPFRPDDIGVMHEAARESQDQLCAWMTWCRMGYSLEDARAFVQQSENAWQKGEHYSFAIVDMGTGIFHGSVGLNHLDPSHKFANLGYWIRAGSTGRGFATAATRLAARFGITELGLNRLELLVPTGNVASQRVAQKAGATFEGTLRRRILLGGEPHDAALYSFVAADFAGPTD